MIELFCRRVLRVQAKNIKRGKGLYEEGVLESRRAALFDRIESWRSIQPLYMPGITQLRQTNGTRTDAMPDSNDSKQPENMPLWLPSSMPSALLQTGCVSGLVEKERKLRIAEADDALAALCRQLRIMTGVFDYKKTHVSGGGQRSNTRARTLMSQITDKTRLFAERYRAARLALTKLEPDGDWRVRLQPLRAEDIRGPGRGDDEESEGRRELSWIWLTPGRAKSGTDGGDEFEVAEGTFASYQCPIVSANSMLIGLRVEWAKSHARAQRWSEETVLLVEEMRRVIAYLDWKATWWHAEADRRQGVRVDIADGLKAYAYRQSDLMRNLAKSFAALWHPVLVAADIPTEWPPVYIDYAKAHPTVLRAPRHQKPKAPLQQENGSSDEESSDEESDGLSGDDEDVSPYR